MFRAGLCCALALSGCSPRIGTIGYGDRDGTVADSALADAADHDANDLDAGLLLPADAATLEDAAPASPDAEQSPNCVLLPDLVSAHALSDGGVLSADTGVISAALDPVLGCTSVPVMGAMVTYGRVDGAPLMRANRGYAFAWTAAFVAGVPQAYNANAPCEQPLVPFAYLIAIASLPGCQPVQVAQDTTLLRINMPVPSPYPQGLKLCESSCPVP